MANIAATEPSPRTSVNVAVVVKTGVRFKDLRACFNQLGRFIVARPSSLALPLAERHSLPAGRRELRRSLASRRGHQKTHLVADPLHDAFAHFARVAPVDMEIIDGNRC